jgi:hypothetical protein
MPPADFEFVVLPDTHYMLPREDAVEFASRRKQNERIERAIETVNALDPAFVVHLGDLVQAFPASDAFERANAAALEQLANLSPKCYHVAGNHDVGDKPDPTMPTASVTKEVLEEYHDRVGVSWYGWSRGSVDFIVLNSQLFNTSLSAAGAQREWFESELATLEPPVVVCTHLPPFLCQPDEPHRGHYDNIGLPARQWLLEEVRTGPVELILSGHTHFQFSNRLEGPEGCVDLRVLPSPAFTRPGFPELFSSCPPSERGRDDRGKLGFTLARVVDGEIRLHTIHTGDGSIDDEAEDSVRMLTPRLESCTSPPLGVSLASPLVETGTVPEAFPSSIRQSVRNDYPMLALLEGGFGHLRTPLEDVEDTVTRDAISTLRRAGASITWTVPQERLQSGNDRDHSIDQVASSDTVELRQLGERRSGPELGDAIAQLRETTTASIGLSATTPDRSVAGKQHERLRTGFDPTTIGRLEERLAEAACAVDGVLCRVGPDPWASITGTTSSSTTDRVGRIDWLLDRSAWPAGTGRRLLAVATLACVATGSRLFVEPLVELDRELDHAPGLLDRQCNRTPDYEMARILNAVLDGTSGLQAVEHDVVDPSRPVYGVESDTIAFKLLLASTDQIDGSVQRSVRNPLSDSATVEVFELSAGRRDRQTSSVAAGGRYSVSSSGPTLVVFRS